MTVSSVSSNALPLPVNNPASSRIRFVDPAKGSESYDGRYPDHSLGGNHGPWLYPFSTTTRKGEDGPGMFMYLRGGTYTNIQQTGWHAPRNGIIGASNTSCQWYYPQKNGTDALRMTMTEYPGEHARFFNASFWSMSHYWTFTNFTMDGDLTYQGTGDGNIYVAIVIGWEEAYCSTEAKCQSNVNVVGNQVIGLALIGNIHIGIQVWGSNHNLYANYVANRPTQQGLGIGHDYNLYLATTSGLTVRDNELHNGSRYNIQAYDETRNCAPLYSDVGRHITDLTIDSNLIDMNQSISPQCDSSTCPKWYGMILGLAWPDPSHIPPSGPTVGAITNVVLKNNLFYVNDGSLNAYHAAFNIYQGANTITLNGVSFYNNTVYGTQFGLYTMTASNTTASNVDVRNNIFSNINSNQWYSQSAGKIAPTWSHNLTDKALNFSGAVSNQRNNVVGNPLFVAASSANFRLQFYSPAVGAGTQVASVTQDFDGKARPNPPTIGAFESGSSQR